LGDQVRGDKETGKLDTIGWAVAKIWLPQMVPASSTATCSSWRRGLKGRKCRIAPVHGCAPAPHLRRHRRDQAADGRSLDLTGLGLMR
jgi:hypothetical protein